MNTNSNTFDWSEQVVLLTGGTGSFGVKFTEIALRVLKPRSLIVFSRDESKQYEMAERYPERPGSCIKYVIGDVRDIDSISRAIQSATVVVHAAAMKHISACEKNPMEAVLTNIIGAKNLIQAAVTHEVPRVISLSTDKAVSPASLYGATKMVAERLFTVANANVNAKTRFSSVRYGNVIGSRGSVVNLFKKQREKGRLTVTDPRMSRFWIDLEGGVRFVIRCVEMMEGGEVFVPKSPSLNIMDLVDVMASGAEVDYIGVRPGDKLNEVLVSEDEARNTVEMEDMFVILPPAQPLEGRWSTGKPVGDGFRYSNAEHSERLSKESLQTMLEEYL